MEGPDLLTIKELGAWKTLSMAQRYAHLSPGTVTAPSSGPSPATAAPEKARAAGTE